MQCVQLWLGKGYKQLSSSSAALVKTPQNSRSMSEFAEVAEKIIQNINSAFEKDDSIDEFDIVPRESRANRSPVIHHHHEHKLALESWCLGFVYTHSFRNFTLLRAASVHNSNTSEVFHSDSNEFFTHKNNNVDYTQFTECERRERSLQLTRILILLNPDLTAAWNFRRDAFRHGHLKLKDELQLVTLVTTRKPKCSEGFYYRRWLVRESFHKDGFNVEQSLNFFQNEAKAALQAASKYFSNYHAWDYRLFLLETWILHKDVPGNIKQEILTLEKQITDTWLNSHISDYCGYHYRQKLLHYIVISQLSIEKNKELFQSEVQCNRDMLIFYPGHESLWYHRKFLVKQYIKLLHNDDTQDDLGFFLENELTLVEEVKSKHCHSEGSDDKYKNVGVNTPINECIQLNRTYAVRYLRWFKISIE